MYEVVAFSYCCFPENEWAVACFYAIGLYWVCYEIAHTNVYENTSPLESWVNTSMKWQNSCCILSPGGVKFYRVTIFKTEHRQKKGTGCYGCPRNDRTHFYVVLYQVFYWTVLAG